MKRKSLEPTQKTVQVKLYKRVNLRNSSLIFCSELVADEELEEDDDEDDGAFVMDPFLPFDIFVYMLECCVLSRFKWPI